MKNENTVHTVGKSYIRTVFFMKFRIIIWVVTVFAAAFVLFGTENVLLQREIADKTLRLHVVANSDSAEDQAHKLVVRDAVLQCVGELTADCTDLQQAQRVIVDNLNFIAQAAGEVSTEKIEVSLGDELFDTRYYETFTLPAGKYRTLRVQIGEAQGKNWWCVVFPSLCTAATTEAVEESAQVGGFEDTQTELIVGGEEKYVFRFKTLQWLKELFS